MRFLMLVSALTGLVLPFAPAPARAEGETPVAGDPAEVCAKQVSPLQALRFERPLAKIAPLFAAEALSDEKIDATIDTMMKDDARGAIFKIEALLRVYREILGKPFTKLYDRVKLAEDALGKYGEKVEYLEFAEQVKAPAEAIAVLQRHADEDRELLKPVLREFVKTLKDLDAAVAKEEWVKEKKDTRQVAEEVARQIQDIEKLDYDMNELQTGIHEMRRQLRWILIYIQAFDGILLPRQSLESVKLQEYAGLVNHPVAASRFSRVDANPVVRHPRYLPTAYFLALSLVVEDLGKVKSYAENVEALGLAIAEAGLASAKEAHKRADELGRTHKTYVPNVIEDARNIRGGLLRTGLLKEIRKALVREDAPEGVVEPAAPAATASGAAAPR